MKRTMGKPTVDGNHHTRQPKLKYTYELYPATAKVDQCVPTAHCTFHEGFSMTISGSVL